MQAFLTDDEQEYIPVGCVPTDLYHTGGGGLCPGDLCPERCLSGGLLSEGLCPGGLCPGGSL